MLTKEIGAPRELLFRADIEPELLVQWLGPRRLTITSDWLDARHGGTWRYIHRGSNGHARAFNGLCHGTPFPDGIVQTREDEGMPGHVFLNTITFEEHTRKSLSRRNNVSQSVQDRDPYVECGTDEGVNDSMERLEELLATLPQEV